MLKHGEDSCSWTAMSVFTVQGIGREETVYGKEQEFLLLTM